jgi:hypothetical protein
MAEAYGPIPIRARAQWLLNVGFLLILFGVLGATLTSRSHQQVGPRGEQLHPLPRLDASLASLAHFLPAYRDYFADHFAFRDRLINWHGKLKLQVFGASASPLVVIGKQGWLYYRDHPWAGAQLGTQPFTKTELIRWQRLLETRDQWLRSRGARYVFVLAPDKHTIYPEFLPARLRFTGVPSRTDQLLAWMRAHSRVRILDLRGAVLRAKGQGTVFLKTDTHWNDLGAYAGYRELMAGLKDWYPEVSPQPREGLREQRSWVKGGNLARLLGLGFMLHDEPTDLVPTTPRRARDEQGRPVTPELLREPGSSEVFHSPGGVIPRAMVVHDSFAWRMAPFLAEHFGRSVFDWSYKIDHSRVEQERPNLVIEEMLELELLDDRHADGP